MKICFHSFYVDQQAAAEKKAAEAEAKAEAEREKAGEAEADARAAEAKEAKVSCSLIGGPRVLLHIRNLHILPGNPFLTC